MPGPLEITLFLLLLVRALSFFAIGPLFGTARIPVHVKLLLGLATAIALRPVVDTTRWIMPETLLGLTVLMGREVLLGALLGFVAQAAFAGIRIAGEIAGLQMGLSMGTLIDPQNTETSMIGLVQETVAAVLFVLLDGHHLLLQGLAFSLDKAPPGTFPDPGPLLAVVTATATTVLLVALQVGAPLLAALFLTDAALGLIARTVPQLNVFVVGVQVKVAVGIVFLVATAPLLARLIGIYSNQAEARILALLGGM